MALLFGYFRATETAAAAARSRAAWCSPASRTTSSPTRRRTPCSTACTAATSTPTNPDVRAFHEAFADIVALFQHFTFTEILQHQIAATRGDRCGRRRACSASWPVSSGAALGRRGALRDAIGDR